MYVFSLSLSFVVALLRGTSKVTMNTQKRSNRMEHCIEVKWVSATYRCSSTAMSAAPVGRMQSKNQRGQSWANWQDQMESKNSRVKNPELVLKCSLRRYYIQGLRHGCWKNVQLLVTNPLFSGDCDGFTILWILVLAFSETVMTSFSSILVQNIMWSQATNSRFQKVLLKVRHFDSFQTS